MESKHIILSVRKAVSALEMFQNRVSEPEVAYNLSFETADTADIDRLQRENREIIAVAPEMPVSLIKPLHSIPVRLTDPLNVSSVAAAATPNVAWGIEAVNAHVSPFSGDGVTVAILDTGIDKAHPAFAHMNLVEKDFTGEGTLDTNGHGTHCAGTIFGRDVDRFRIGVAPGVKNALIGKVLGHDGGTTRMVFDAMNWAVNQKAHIISMSLGMDFPGMVKQLTRDGMQIEPATSVALESYRKNVILFEKLVDLIRTRVLNQDIQPVMIVAAAGNESNRPHFEIALSPPAVADGIISVGALRRMDQDKLSIAYFSNTGPLLSGPGVEIVSARSGGGLTSMDGTSMATPHVAGVAALWAEKLIKNRQFNLPHWTASVTAGCTVTRIDYNNNVAFGAGLVQAPR